MIRYDVLWNDLRDSVNQMYSNAVASANYFKNEDEERRINEEIAHRCVTVLASNRRLYMEMIEMDKLQQNENLTLQEILQELKKLNKGKEEEEDGELDREGADPGSESSGEQEDRLQ